MPLNFPDGPAPGTVWARWRFDGTKWTIPPWRPAEPPVGEIIDWPTEVAPDDGWLICDGHWELIWQYPDLYNLIGGRFGTDGNGFGLPDLRGSTIVGLDPHGTGRITIMDVANVWSRGGSWAVQQHQHTLTGGSHVHGMEDPSHLHGINQWAAHGHGWHDPGHHHGTHQSPHSHGLADPAHTHGKPDPTHTHLQGHSWDTRRSWYPQQWYMFVQGGAVHTTANGIGVWNDASGAGLNVHGENANVSVDGAGTGIWTHAAGIPISNYHAHTGIWLSGSGCGITHLTEGGGLGAEGWGNNYQPEVEMAKVVRARGVAGVGVLPDTRSGRLDFPTETNPPPGTVFDGRWVWDGVKWDRRPHNYLPGGTRIGSIIDWSDWPNVPDRYILCDGREVSREAYPRLFLWMGTTYGGGNGVTTFNLPDTRARATVGYDNIYTGRLTVEISGINPTVVGWGGGDQRMAPHAHNVSGDPGHAHHVNDPGHAHGVWQDYHNHGLVDPGHAHGFPQSPHGHGQSGGHHNHGWNGGMHFHNQYHGWLADYGWIDWGDYWSVVWGNYWIGYSYSNVANADSGVGCWTGGNYAWIDVHGSGVGQWIDAAWDDCGFHWGGTGVGIHWGEAAPGMVVELNSGGGAWNLAPSCILPKLIYAGVAYA